MTSKLNLHQFLSQPAPIVAKELLGSYLERTFEDGSVSLVKIVETEAYDQTDVASHSYNGMTPRTEVMFGEPGHLYVYFTYGMHYCCNIVVGPKGHGAAVLIRAVEPIDVTDNLLKFRRAKNEVDLTNGPAKLCQSLNIKKDLNGHDLTQSPIKLQLKLSNEQSNAITETPRIGISKGKEIKWRFYLTDNKYVSRN